MHPRFWTYVATDLGFGLGAALVITNLRDIDGTPHAWTVVTSAIGGVLLTICCPAWLRQVRERFAADRNPNAAAAAGDAGAEGSDDGE